MFLMSYSNTSGSLGELEMLWEQEVQASISHNPQLFQVLPNLNTSVSITRQ